MMGIEGAVWRKIAVTAVLFVAFLRAIGGAGAQTPEVTMTVDPASGPPGTTLTVSGTGCSIVPPDPSTDGPEQVFVQLLAADGTPVADTTTPAETDGTWSTQITVPESIADGEQLTVSAICQGDSAITYGSSTFGVESVQPPGTTTTTGAATPPGSTTTTYAGTSPGSSSPGSSPTGSPAGAAPTSSDEGSQLVVPTAEPATPTGSDPEYTG